jgi:hypothetical protein
MAPNGLLDQQHIALATGAEARAAAVRRTTPLVQEGVGGSARRLIGRDELAGGRQLAFESADRAGAMFLDTLTGSSSSFLGSLGRVGSIFLESGKGLAFFDALGSDVLVAGGSASWLAAQRDLPRAGRRLAVSPTMQHQDLVSHVTAIRDLIHREQVSAARRVLDLIPGGASEEPAIAKLRRALTPPTVRPSIRKDTDRTRAYEWLRQHAWEYRGQWVAVAEDGLIAAAPTLKQLRQQLEALEPTQQPLIHKL